MRDVIIGVRSVTAYSASKPLTVEKQKDETHDEFERRIWPEKAHYDADGYVCIPGMGFKLALDEVASLLKEKIKGKGNQTYTKQFQTGCTAMSDLRIGVQKKHLKTFTGIAAAEGEKIQNIQREHLTGIAIYCDANGQRGSGTRVTRYFPIIPSWCGEVRFRVFNDTLPQDVFERYFAEAGMLMGIGRGRPAKGCAAGNGRFRPFRFTWIDNVETQEDAEFGM